jgi:hypothetical protein
MTNTLNTDWSACKPKFLIFSFYNNGCEWGYTTLIANNISFNPYTHLIQKNWETWIFVDNYWDDTILKYQVSSSLRNINDFVIEFNVRWWALKRSGKNYFLLNNNDLRLYLNNTGNLILKVDSDSTNNIISPSNISTIVTNNDDFYKISIISEWSNVSLKLNSFNTIWKSETIILNRYQYIWLYASWTRFQWNEIIDYIKIYIK